MLWKQLEPVHQAERAFDCCSGGSGTVGSRVGVPGIDHRKVKRKHHLVLI